MPFDRKPSLIVPVAVAAVLLAGYVWAYYWMVRPNGRTAFYTEFSGFSDFEAWKAAQMRWASPFAPIHWVDRHVIRRSVWKPTP